MTTEELSKLREAAQQSCNKWAEALGLQQWNIVVEVIDEDKDLDELPRLEYNQDIASAKVQLVTGDTWKKIYPNFWAPYSMEVHIVAQLLALMLREDTCDLITLPLATYHLARVVVSLNNQVVALQSVLENMQHQPEQEEEPKSEIVEEEPIDETKSEN